MHLGTDATAELTASAAGLVSCHVCLRLNEPSQAHCTRCKTRLHVRIRDSLQVTLALLITASLLYIPANIYPIMFTDQLGSSTESTILGGVVLLIEMGSIPIAAVIFFASVLVPLGKMAALYYLTWSAWRGHTGRLRERTWLYHLTESIGKWSMVDVFVVALLVALVQLGDLLVIRPGIAALSFAAVVIVTMLAANTFDPRLMWDGVDDDE